MFPVKFTSGISSSEFMVNTVTLIGGTGIAQILPVLFAPLIARLFGTDDFSVYGVFVSIYGIMGVVLALRYEPAIMLPQKERDATSIVFLCLMSALALSVVFFMIALIFRNQIASVFNISQLSAFLPLIPVSALFFSVNTILIVWYNRNKKYKVIAANKIARNSLLTGSNIGFGFAKTGYAGLIYSQIISDALAAVYYLSLFFRKRGARKDFSMRNMRKVATEYRKFPMYTLPSTFIDTLSAQIPILLIAALYTQEMSGSYFFSYRILILPLSVIGAAYAQTFYQKFVSYLQISNFNGAMRFLRKSWMLLAGLIIVPGLILASFGQPLFSFVFSSEWAESGKMASILIFYIMFAFVSSPTSSTYIALGMQKYTLIFSVIVLFYRFGTLYFGWLSGDFYLGLKLLVCFEIAEIIIYNLIVVITLRKRQHHIESEKTE
jgi:lipopolysaccharide exporter